MLAGIRETGDDELWAESTNRGAEARAPAAHPHAQPSQAHMHCKNRQRENPGKRGEPPPGAAGG